LKTCESSRSFCETTANNELTSIPLPQNTQATGTQLHQIGHAHKLVSDWSDKEEVDRWIKAFEKETQRKISILPKVDSSGYPPLKAEVGFDFVRCR
jgi:hypothetical protein